MTARLLASEVSNPECCRITTHSTFVPFWFLSHCSLIGLASCYHQTLPWLSHIALGGFLQAEEGTCCSYISRLFSGILMLKLSLRSESCKHSWMLWGTSAINPRKVSGFEGCHKTRTPNWSWRDTALAVAGGYIFLSCPFVHLCAPFPWTIWQEFLDGISSNLVRLCKDELIRIRWSKVNLTSISHSCERNKLRDTWREFLPICHKCPLGRWTD